MSLLLINLIYCASKINPYTFQHPACVGPPVYAGPGRKVYSPIQYTRTI